MVVDLSILRGRMVCYLELVMTALFFEIILHDVGTGRKGEPTLDWSCQ